MKFDYYRLLWTELGQKWLKFYENRSVYNSRNMTSEKISILTTVALVHAVEVIPVQPFGAVKAAGQHS